MQATIVIEGPALFALAVVVVVDALTHVAMALSIANLKRTVHRQAGIIDGLRDGLRAAAPDEKV